MNIIIMYTIGMSEWIERERERERNKPPCIFILQNFINNFYCSIQLFYYYKWL